jgi:hypothetical protein
VKSPTALPTEPSEISRCDLRFLRNLNPYCAEAPDQEWSGFQVTSNKMGANIIKNQTKFEN